MDKLTEHAEWLIDDPEDADGVIFMAKVRMKKAQVEAGLIEMAAYGAGWDPLSGQTAGAACNAAVVRFSNAAVLTARANELEQEKQVKLSAFRSAIENG